MRKNPSNNSEDLKEKIDRIVGAMPRPIALVGFGVEGRGTLDFLLVRETGEKNLRVFDHALDAAAVDKNSAEFGGAAFYGDGDWTEPLSQCGTIFRSPGVRPDLPALSAARAAGAVVTSATELFLSLCPCKVAGVTGTVGKGTTTSLIGEALKASGITCRLGGNIGINPLAFLWDIDDEDVAVLELSSFQLMELQGRRPEVAVILRTSSEHLDWHKDVAEYRRAKGRLLEPDNAEQTVIYCADSEGSAEIVSPCAGRALAVSLQSAVDEGVGMIDGRLHRFREGESQPLSQLALPQLDELAMPGRFNRENAAAAWLAAEALGVASPGIETLGAASPGIGAVTQGTAVEKREPHPGLGAIAAFPGLQHRLERVGGAGGVACYNDSYATRPDATLAALMDFEQPLALIMGGSEKFADFSALCEQVCRHGSLRRVLLIGTTAERLEAELRAAAARLGQDMPPVIRCGSLEEAFQAGLEALNGAGVLLFSPGCASFDMFPNYKVRGERFRALVEGSGGG